MLLIISFRELLFSDGSTIFIAVPSFQFLHAYKKLLLDHRFHFYINVLEHVVLKSILLNEKEEITVTKGRLTKLSRSSIFSPLLMPLFFWPLTISRTNTPKLKTSDFTENCPCIAYSGAIYPLHVNMGQNY